MFKITAGCDKGGCYLQITPLLTGVTVINHSDCFRQSLKIYENFCFVSHQRNISLISLYQVIPRDQITNLPLWWHKLHSCFQAERVGSGWISAVITGNLPSQAVMTHIGSTLQWSYSSHWQRKRTCIQHFVSIKCTLESLEEKESTADWILSVNFLFTQLQVKQVTPP